MAFEAMELGVVEERQCGSSRCAGPLVVARAMTRLNQGTW